MSQLSERETTTNRLRREAEGCIGAIIEQIKDAEYAINELKCRNANQGIMIEERDEIITGLQETVERYKNMDKAITDPCQSYRVTVNPGSHRALVALGFEPGNETVIGWVVRTLGEFAEENGRLDDCIEDHLKEIKQLKSSLATQKMLVKVANENARLAFEKLEACSDTPSDSLALVALKLWNENKTEWSVGDLASYCEIGLEEADAIVREYYRDAD